MLRERGYDQVTHMLEFFGVCPDCRKKAASASALTAAAAAH
jgi:Fe2+ or Zn2+ uptake regulation protein